MHAYFVCDYCAHVHTLATRDDRATCESCGQPLARDVWFEWLADAEDFSQRIIDYNREPVYEAGNRWT